MKAQPTVSPRFPYQERAHAYDISLKRTWGMVEWQRRQGPRHRTRSQDYAKAFLASMGDPHRRIQRIATKYKVEPASVRKALQRYWGRSRYLEFVPFDPRGPGRKAVRMDPWNRPFLD